MILTTSFDLSTRPFTPEYDGSVWANIKQAAINGTLPNVLSIGDRFGIPVTGASSGSTNYQTYTCTFAVVELTNTDVVIDMIAGVFRQLVSSQGNRHYEPSTLSQRSVFGDLPQEVKDQMAYFYRPSEGEIYGGVEGVQQFDYYKTPSRRIKYLYAPEMSSDKTATTWGLGVASPYVNERGERVTTSYSISGLMTYAFVINNE